MSAFNGLAGVAQPECAGITVIVHAGRGYEDFGLCVSRDALSLARNPAGERKITQEWRELRHSHVPRSGT